MRLYTDEGEGLKASGGGKPVFGLVWLRSSGGREMGKGGGEFKEREGWMEGG